MAPDPGFAAIWPLVATAPLSILAMLVSLVAAPFEWDSPHAWVGSLIFSVGTALSGLFNAVLLGRLARVLRAQLPRAAA